MRLLLDTHVWLWAALKPAKLSRRVAREINRPRNEVYLSPVSIWEAELLDRSKHIRFKPDFPAWVKETLAQMPVKEAPFTFAVATEAAYIRLPQLDPGDTFIAATAVAYDMTLVTSDHQLLDCSWLKTLPNE